VPSERAQKPRIPALGWEQLRLFDPNDLIDQEILQAQLRLNREVAEYNLAMMRANRLLKSQRTINR